MSNTVNCILDSCAKINEEMLKLFEVLSYLGNVKDLARLPIAAFAKRPSQAIRDQGFHQVRRKHGLLHGKRFLRLLKLDVFADDQQACCGTAKSFWPALI
jgi:hypothetical protein